MNILIVDDDSTNRMVLKAMLVMEGHSTFEAVDGQEAIDFYESKDPDLILMDVMMPNVDGYSATTEIKEKSKGNFIPIIFLTSMTDEASLVKCVESGGDDFLTKPYNRVILQAKIKALDRIRLLNAENIKQNALLLEYFDRSERDQNVAEKIYSNLMGRSEKEPRIIEYLHKPADKFNGDLVLWLRKPGGGINLLVGDFTGHGLGAAIGALPAAEVFLGMTVKGFSIHDIILEINNRLLKLLPTGMFLAAVLVDVDIKEQRIAIWNGGLPDMYVFDGTKNKISRTVGSSTLPLGVVKSKSLTVKETVLKLTSGDSIIVHSDGVIETDNINDEFYGTERFEALIESSIPKGDFIEEVYKDVTEFRGEVIQRDDLTVVHFKFDWDFLNDIDVAETNNGRYTVSSDWKFNLNLSYDTLQQTDPIPLIVQFIVEIQGFNEHKGNIFTILSELIVNSLDHGLLNLESSIKSTPEGFLEYFHERENRLTQLTEGWINMSVENKTHDNSGELIIIISDSGAGFEFDTIMHKAKSLQTKSGRGLLLINELSTSMTYDSGKNSLEVLYFWDHEA